MEVWLGQMCFKSGPKLCCACSPLEPLGCACQHLQYIKIVLCLLATSVPHMLCLLTPTIHKTCVVPAHHCAPHRFCPPTPTIKRSHPQVRMYSRKRICSVQSSTFYTKIVPYGLSCQKGECSRWAVVLDECSEPASVPHLSRL